MIEGWKFAVRLSLSLVVGGPGEFCRFELRFKFNYLFGEHSMGVDLFFAMSFHFLVVRVVFFECDAHVN